MTMMKNKKIGYINVKGVTVKSKVEPKQWIVEVAIPLNNLPIKNIKYGNVIRGILNAGCAWSPTFALTYGHPESFGELIFK